MPFPWKKKKVARLSNFVADLHSPKRGSSLVVQTGFPTSLIDLFVKNRSRFQKPKPWKRPPHEIHDPPPPGPADLSGCVLPRADPICPEASTSKRLVGNGEDGVPGSEQVRDRLGECSGGSNSDPNKIIAAVLKMLVVLAVILSVKKLTFGITISAFVLLLLEFAGKHFVSWSRPCSDANMAFKYFAQRISICNWFQNPVSVMGNRQSYEGSEPPSLVREKIEVPLSSGSPSVDEIEIVEAKSEIGTENRREEICFLGSALNSFYEDKKGVGSEIEEAFCEITQDKTKSKRSGRLKSKIAKSLVPKKLRGLKKKKRTKDREEIEKLSKEKEAESGGEVPSSVELDELAISEIEEEGGEGIEEQDIWSKPECIEDEEVDFGVTGSYRKGEEGEGNIQEQEQERIDRGGSSESSGALMLLGVALAGLVVGRFVAFLFAVTWMFMLKILKSRGRSLNVHLVKSCELISP
ncbi:uncharacterized protein LOC114718279 [Neltuma alba]|uniref:uncharacterized protein LOC114718279 n=1 Tax=Neltuma alba TaxID=207710 RepID=UPI0010A4C3BA|nr:uncharacterized protein LOC114718279 [Prosopis alba]